MLENGIWKFATGAHECESLYTCTRAWLCWLAEKLETSCWSTGLTKAELMGDLTVLLQLPAYQLALPFFAEAQRQLALVECLPGTAL